MRRATRLTIFTILTVSLVCIVGFARAESDRNAETLDALWQRVVEKLNQASDELEPPLVPPEPVDVRWQAKRISSIDLDAPLLALDSRDLDGDQRAEILALTTRELIIVDRRGRRKLAIRARIQIPGPMAPIRPRNPIGSMVVSDLDGDGSLDIAVRSSERAKGAVFGYQDGALIEKPLINGFPVCASVFVELDPGRNYFATVTITDATSKPPDKTDEPKPKQPPVSDSGNKTGNDRNSTSPTPPVGTPMPVSLRDVAFGSALPPRFFSSRCRDDMVDTIGRQLSVVGIVGNDKTLHLWSQKRCPRRDQACRESSMTSRTLANMGVAFELGDIDRDGHPEVVVTAASPPGEPDHVTVLSWRGTRMKRLFRRAFSGGVVGVTAGDIDGNGALDVLAAVRLWGSHRVDMWVFN